MRYNLRNRLSLSYIMIAMLCVFLISILSNIFLERQFRAYIIQNQVRKNQETIQQVSYFYQKNNGWNRADTETIGVNALESGLMLDIRDVNNKVIWNATTYNNGMCQQMMMHMNSNMLSRYPNWKGGYEVSTYPITSGGKIVGTVAIGYYGPFYFNDHDLAFINTLNHIIISVGIVSLIASLFFGYLMAKGLSKPISRVINTAQMISKGYYNDRCVEKSNINEITQLTDAINELAESLQKQEQLRKRLTADVAHELRTPLATLQSHMEAMIDGVWTASPERLKGCHEEIVRMGRLVGDLERLVQYESENLTLNKTTFDIYELIKVILTNFEGAFKKMKIQVAFEEANLLIHADRDKISQVVINLISNAIKYSHEGGRIKICVADMKETVVLSIDDDGIGICEKDLPLVFERFYRSDPSRNRETGGAGIGLTIAKSIVEAHKGTISVESTLNEGSTFTVCLPKAIL